MLIWTPVPTASTYRLEIFTEDGQPLWTGNVSTPPVRWPNELARTKGAYRWRVEAQNSDGAIARSPLALLELTR